MVNISTLGQSLAQISRLKTQQQTMGDLSTQIATGKKTQKLSGLGNDIIKSIRSRAGVGSLETYVDNIKNAERRLNLMQTSIREIKKQAENISNSIIVTLQEGDYPDLEAIQSLADNVLSFIIDAMNQTDGDRYLFSGGDTAQPPITDSGLFDSFLGEFIPDVTDITNPPLVASGVIGDWGDGTITTDQFINSYKNVSDTILGFSNALTTNTAGKTTVRVNDGSEFDYTTLANDTSMREIIVVLGLIKSLPPPEYAPGALNDPTATSLAEDTPPFPPTEKQENFYKVINDLAATLNAALKGLDQELYRLSQVQAQITIVKNGHTDQINTFKNVIGEVEDVDLTEASTRITQLQIQLEASFSVTALLSQLTLANFLR